MFTTSNLHEAHLVKGLLEANKIDVFSFDDKISTMNHFWMNAVGGIKLMVDKKQELLAKEVLAEYRGKEGLDPASGSTSPWS